MKVKIKPVFLFEEVRNKESVGAAAWGQPKRLVPPSPEEMKEITKEIKQWIAEDVEILEPILVSDQSSFEKLKQETTLDVDIFLFGTYSGGWILKEKIAELGPIQVKWNPRNLEAVNRAIRLARTRKKLWRTKAIVIGVIETPYTEQKSWDFQRIRRNLGVAPKQVEMLRLLNERKKCSEEEVERIAKEWEKEADEIIGPTHAQICESVRTYLAVKKIMKEEQANAVTMNCAVLPNVDFVPCLGFAKMISEGIPAGCENDIQALVAMCILMYLSGKPAIMGNFWYEFKTNRVVISHCVLPQKIIKEGSPYILRDFHGTGKGVTGYGDIETEGPITILGINRGFDKFHIIKGKVFSIEDGGKSTSCRYKIRVDVEDVQKIARERVGDHHAAVLGDYVEDLVQLGKILKVETIVT